MLEVTFYRDARGRFRGLRARGHAGFDADGRDIVCAGVSAILQATRLGLATHAKAELGVRQTKGTLELSWPVADGERESVRAIVATAELAVAQIARQYPGNVRLKRGRLPDDRGQNI